MRPAFFSAQTVSVDTPIYEFSGVVPNLGVNRLDFRKASRQATSIGLRFGPRRHHPLQPHENETQGM
jgi:hypothetical protein